MNAILGFAKIGKEAKDNAGKMENCLRKIDDASEQLLELLNSILDISKIETNKFELSMEWFSLRRSLQSTIQIYTTKATEKNQHVSVNIDKSVANEYEGDKLRLMQIVTNLLTNAIKFTPVSGKICVNVRQTEQFESESGEKTAIVEFAVSDNGIGIEESQMHKLFQSFEQVDGGIARMYGGTGLGLSISKSFVELMGGEISVKSTLGEGSVFTFTVKMKVGEEYTETQEETESAETQFDVLQANEKAFEVTDYSKHTILLVEDIKINREIVISLLEPTNVNIETADNGRIAVDMFAANPAKYSLIFMDMLMPVLSGVDATKMLRALDVPNNDIPIIAMTANAFQENIRECKAAGMDGHIAKPIEEGNVLSILSNYLTDERLTKMAEMSKVIVQTKKEEKHEAKQEEKRTEKKADVPNVSRKQVQKKPAPQIDAQKYADFLPEIDVAAGLSRVRANQKLYKSIINSFNASELINNIRSAMERNDSSEAQNENHTMKGVSSNLCLPLISEASKALDDELVKGNIKWELFEALERNVDATLLKLDKLMDDDEIWG
jgi:CheY-like chemotaxis protein/HPt (histidine-containing phosphotransfer) domain-containing protein